MEKFKIKEGFTKAGIIAQVVSRNNGTRCVVGHSCKYRGVNEDNACFMGAFIPDEDYERGFEGDNAETLLRRVPSLKKFMPLDIEGMGELQAVHDLYIDYLKKPRKWYWPFKESLHDRLINFVNERLEY